MAGGQGLKTRAQALKVTARLRLVTLLSHDRDGPHFGVCRDPPE